MHKIFSIVLVIFFLNGPHVLASAAPSPANDTIVLTDRVSIKTGDIILSVNGKKMKNNVEALATIGQMKKTAPIEMDVLRDNKIKKLTFSVKK